MSRKHCTRRVTVPLPPRGLRAKLAHAQVRDLSICHIQNLDIVANGRGTEDTLWHLVEAALTWSRVAEKLGAGEPEMGEQLALVTSLVTRYERTGKVLFTGPEYQLAKSGVEVMDQLSEIVDRPTAVDAVEWSERKLVELQRHCRARGMEKAPPRQIEGAPA